MKLRERKSTGLCGSFETNKPKRMSFDINFIKLFNAAGIIFIIFMMIWGLHNTGIPHIFIALFIILSTIVIAIVIILDMRSHNRHNRRQNEIIKWAKSKGFKLRLTPDLGIGSRYGLFKCMVWGTECFAHTIIEGTFANRQICAFDYYSYEKEKNPKLLYPGANIGGSFMLSTVIVEAGLKLKPLFIRPENLVDKIFESAGIEDISLESTEFNKQFHVKSADRRWAYDVLNQSTMDLLLNSPRFIIEFQDRHVMAYRKDALSAADFDAAMQLITGILDRLPESLVR